MLRSAVWKKEELWEARCGLWVQLFSSRRLVVVHIPKAGGTSCVCALFNEPRSQHWTISELKSVPSLRQFPSFAVVRNPFWRFVSAYNYLRCGGNPDIAVIKDNLAWSQLLKSMPFRQFVILLTDNSPKGKRLFDDTMAEHGAKDVVMFTPQHRFICIADRVAVDLVVKMEQIAAEGFVRLGKLSKEIGDVPVGHWNKTKRKTVSDLDEETALKIYDFYKRDFELFGYSKDSWQDGSKFTAAQRWKIDRE